MGHFNLLVWTFFRFSPNLYFWNPAKFGNWVNWDLAGTRVPKFEFQLRWIWLLSFIVKLEFNYLHKSGDQNGFWRHESNHCKPIEVLRVWMWSASWKTSLVQSVFHLIKSVKIAGLWNVNVEKQLPRNVAKWLKLYWSQKQCDSIVSTKVVDAKKALGKKLWFSMNKNAYVAWWNVQESLANRKYHFMSWVSIWKSHPSVFSRNILFWKESN